MRRFVLRRGLQSLVVLFLFLTAIFFLAQIIMPGDFAILLRFGEGAEKVDELRQEVGLNLPIWQRYFIWMGNVLKGDLGRSFYRTPDFRFPGSRMIRLPVTAIVGRGLLLSAMIFGIGTLIAYQLGAWLGKNLAWRKQKTFTGIVTFIGIVLYTAFPPLIAWIATEINRKLGLFNEIITMDAWREHYLEGPLWRPSTFAALMLATLLLVAVLLVAFKLVIGRRYRWRIGTVAYSIVLIAIWVGGWFAIGAGARFMDIVNFLGLALIIFVLISFGETMLMMRTSMTDTLYEEYIFAARAKGLPEKLIRDKHATRNALLPVLSRLVVNIPFLLTGLVIIEYAVGTGGMGSVLFDSLRSQDVPVMMGALVLIGIIALASRLCLEIVIAYLDPRIRFHQVSSEISTPGTDVGGESLLQTLKSYFLSLLKPRRKKKIKTDVVTSSGRLSPSQTIRTTRWKRIYQHL